MQTATPAQLARIKKDWEAIAQESLTVEQIGGAFYAFGSELATLRLAYKYRYSADKCKAEYSKNLQTWFFRLD